MKIAFCWATITGYMSSCWEVLNQRSGVDVFVLTCLPQGEFDESRLLGNITTRALKSNERYDSELIGKYLSEFDPEALFLSGWMNPAYVKVALSKQFAHIPVIMAMDNPRRIGSTRQTLTRLKIGQYLNRIDGAFVTGERSWQFARYLKIPEQKIWRGSYGANIRDLAPLIERRKARPQGWPKRFLYLGQYIERKGLRTLCEAYRLYRDAVNDPWPLRTCGSGPLREQFTQTEGIEDFGFVQPPDLLQHLVESGVLVHASLEENWGMVIVEACAAGLPVVCSDACGAAVELVHHHYNGLMAATGDPISLASRLIWMHTHYDELETMGVRSGQLGAAYSAERWADRVLGILSDVEDQRRRSLSSPLPGRGK